MHSQFMTCSYLNVRAYFCKGHLWFSGSNRLAAILSGAVHNFIVVHQHDESIDNDKEWDHKRQHKLSESYKVRNDNVDEEPTHSMALHVLCCVLLQYKMFTWLCLLFGWLCLTTWFTVLLRIGESGYDPDHLTSELRNSMVPAMCHWTLGQYHSIKDKQTYV